MKKLDFKVKINGEEQSFFLREPSSVIKRKAEEYKSEVFKREAFKKDSNGKSTAIFAKEVYNLIREKGIWTDADEAELKDIIEQIDKKLSLLSKGKSAEVDSLSKLRSIIVNDISELRTRQFRLMSKSTQFHEITVEAISQEAENDYLTACCTFTENDELVFQSVEDMKNSDPDLVAEATSQMAILLGLSDPDWVLKLPENELLKKYKMIDEKGRYVLNGHRVNSDGKRINEDGHLINDNNELIDDEGNLVDKDGNLIGYTKFDEEE